MLTLTLANPDQLNAQVPSLWTALAAVGADLPDDVRVVVLRAEGRAFSAGLNRAMFSSPGLPGELDIFGLAGAADDPEVIAAEVARFQAGFTVWREVPQVVVAAVQGHAVGAGFQLALAADLRVVADDVQFAMREVPLGIVPDLAGTHTLVHLVGYARALEICATGRRLGADEAVRLGLANLAVPVAELATATEDLVAALLAAPAHSLRALKPLLAQAISASAREQHRNEQQAQATLLHAVTHPRRP